MEYSGIYKDGWVEERAHVTLKGGGPARLVLRAEVLPHQGQHLDVSVDGRSIISENVEAGPLDLRVPLPSSTKDRRVELVWAGSTRIGEQDSRRAAAHLKFLDIAPLRYPSVLRVPEGQGDAGLEFSGIHGDGWIDGAAHVMLAAGQAADLVIHCDVSTTGQRLEVLVDEQRVLEQAVGAGRVRTRTPVPASDDPRRVDLRWTETARLGPSDDRSVAARLLLIGLVTEGAPSRVRVPQGLGDPEVEYSGIHPDGWMEQECWVMLAGGEPANLVVRAELSQVQGQSLTILAEGTPVAGQDVGSGPLELRVPLPASKSDRRIEFRWAGTTPVSKKDSRQVAGLLHSLGLARGRPPSALRRFPADLDDPDLEYEGVYPDGWLQKEARFSMAGGEACDLALRVEVLPATTQRLSVVVDGKQLETRELKPGPADLRVPLPASSEHRSIELHWASIVEINERDSREAAAHLKHLGLVPKSGA